VTLKIGFYLVASRKAEPDQLAYRAMRENMFEVSQYNPTGRFTGLAKSYAQFRPSYPASAIDFVVNHCRLDSNSLLVDVGSGTGIASRLFATRGMEVIGVEPNAEMREAAASAAVGAKNLRLTYQGGTAEATGLPGGIADIVLAAQAFHWFEVDATLREFHRILKSDGWAVLMWNERDERDAFTAAYSAVIHTAPDVTAVEIPRGQAGLPLLVSPLFQAAQRVVFANEQVLSEDELLGRAFSASYAPREPTEASVWADKMRDIFSRYQEQGKVVLRYETVVYLALRRTGYP
jgi:SAM-dependent methyltransferase